MADGGIPVAPRILEDLLLAQRACRLFGATGEPVELWEAYVLAQADSAALTAEVDRGSASPALQSRLREVRGDTAPLVEYLRQVLPTTVALLSDAKSLDLSLVFIMSSPPARDAVVR